MPPNSKKDDGLGSKSSNERTPLLTSVEPLPIAEPASPSQQHDNQNDDISETQQENEAEETPGSRSQIFLLCYTAVVEPIAFFGIFPYINFMIEKVGHVPKEEVGFYSGLIESLFSATQMCVLILWGKVCIDSCVWRTIAKIVQASDRYGRKPPLIISLVGVAISMTLFGMSQSLWQMIAMRCLAGIFAGTVVTVRAMLSENSTKSTQAMAFSYFAFARNLGLFVGPLLGQSVRAII